MEDKNENIPDGKLCDSDCGDIARFFSEYTGRYRCQKSANSCPVNKKKNSNGLRKAHKEGKMTSFTDKMRKKSNISYRRNLIESRKFEDLGHILRKKIVSEDQDFKCFYCGLDEWMDLRITLELDHIDGDNKNNKRENLRCLCPNCHSITYTWKRVQFKQNGIRKVSDKEILEAYKNMVLLLKL